MNSKFLAKILGLTAVMALGTAVFHYLAQPVDQIWYWVTLAFYLLVGIVISIRTQKAVTSESNSRFFTGVMGSTGIRMILCIGFLAIYLMVSDLKSREFIVFYLIAYLFYTIFEMSQLVSKLRPEKRSSLDNTTI